MVDLMFDENFSVQNNCTINTVGMVYWAFVMLEHCFHIFLASFVFCFIDHIL
jgi:hypothetical protein